MKSKMNLMALLVLVAASLFVNDAQACRGRLFGRGRVQACGQTTRFVQCASADNKVYARVYLDAYRPYQTIVWKTDTSLPSYNLNCTQGTAKGTWLVCSEPGNRTLIVNNDYTARYIGTHETHDLTCQTYEAAN